MPTTDKPLFSGVYGSPAKSRSGTRSASGRHLDATSPQASVSCCAPVPGIVQPDHPKMITVVRLTADPLPLLPYSDPPLLQVDVRPPTTEARRSHPDGSRARWPARRPRRGPQAPGWRQGASVARQYGRSQRSIQFIEAKGLPRSSKDILNSGRGCNPLSGSFGWSAARCP